MAHDWRAEPEGSEDPDERPIDVNSAIRAAKTAAALGRAPAPATTAKIGAFDLEQALARSRARSVPPPSSDDATAAGGDPDPEASGRPTMPVITDVPASDAGPAEVAPAPRRGLAVVVALIVLVVGGLFVAAMLSQR